MPLFIVVLAIPTYHVKEKKLFQALLKVNTLQGIPLFSSETYMMG